MRTPIAIPVTVPRTDLPSVHADGFHVVAVRIVDEARVVGRAVVRAQPRGAVVRAAGLQCRRMECGDGLAVLGLERHVRAAARVVRDGARRLQHRLVEGAAGGETLHLESDVIVHACSSVDGGTLLCDVERPFLENLAVLYARRATELARRDAGRPAEAAAPHIRERISLMLFGERPGTRPRIAAIVGHRHEPGVDESADLHVRTPRGTASGAAAGWSRSGRRRPGWDGCRRPGSAQDRPPRLRGRRDRGRPCACAPRADRRP